LGYSIKNQSHKQSFRQTICLSVLSSLVLGTAQ
jgi:hypothetical protein